MLNEVAVLQTRSFGEDPALVKAATLLDVVQLSVHGPLYLKAGHLLTPDLSPHNNPLTTVWIHCLHTIHKQAPSGYRISYCSAFYTQTSHELYIMRRWWVFPWQISQYWKEMSQVGEDTDVMPSLMLPLGS